MEKEQELFELSDKLQKECHELIDDGIIRNPKCRHQDLTNVWMFKKLAHYELRIIELEKLLGTNKE